MGLRELLPHPLRLTDGWGLVRCVRAPDGSWVRVLEVDGSYQSASYLDERRMEPVFAYHRAFDRVFSLRPGARRVLMLGGGGCSWPKHVLASGPAAAALDVVEREPAVIDAARRWFFVDEAQARWPGRLCLIEGEARAYLDDYAGTPYDAIVIDAFAGVVPAPGLVGVAAARAVRRCLVLDGLALVNVVSEDAGADLSVLVETLRCYRAAFSHVEAVVIPDDPLAVEDNYLLIASDATLAVPDAIKGGNILEPKRS